MHRDNCLLFVYSAVVWVHDDVELWNKNAIGICVYIEVSEIVEKILFDLWNLMKLSCY